MTSLSIIVPRLEMLITGTTKTAPRK